MLTCEKCHAPGMRATRIPRFSGVARVLGFLCMIPSALGMLLVSSYWLIAVAQTAGRADVSVANMAVGGLGFAIVILTFFLGVPSFLIGYLLISRKKVWRCGLCDFVFDRA